MYVQSQENLDRLESLLMSSESSDDFEVLLVGGGEKTYYGSLC